jgi:hypothetical protein
MFAFLVGRQSCKWPTPSAPEATGPALEGGAGQRGAEWVILLERFHLR